ncbi:sensor histidine kinase [Bacillus sp. USDA818B3_A]|uniref:sensor histidine kinase n=1 Tax=Bacillus sp. USDA818B3_A TaxID=2698834 RepID=UPI00136CEB6F|nr:histidine kinase [Bacillus sp. USDA818B3_A]
MIRKLTTILVISFVAVNAVFLAGVTLMANKVFFDFTSDEISQSKLELLNESTGKVSTFISSVKEVGTYIAADRTVREIFSENLTNSYDAVVEQRELTEICNAVMSLKSAIYSVEIYTDRYKNYPNLSTNVIYPLQTLEKEPWMKMFNKMDNGWVPKHVSLSNSNHDEVISYIHRITGPKGATAGYLKVNVLDDTFFKNMGVEDLVNGGNEPLMLLNTGGNIIAQNSATKYQNVIADITVSSLSEPFNMLIDSYKDKSDFHHIIKHNNDLYLLLISKPNYDQWRMVHLIPVASLYAKTKKLGMFVLFLGLCGLALSIPFAYWIGKKLMKPIGQLIQGMKYVEKGQFDIELGPYYIEEYDILSKNFNHMTSRLSESLDNLKQENHFRREAELKVLQSQINPHFLYNTLDMIHWKAMDHHAEDISLMVNQLSKMLRIGLSGGQKFIQLRDELEHVKCYTNIQIARLGKDIHFDIKVPASMKDFYVPKIILQPFIENSIRHGYPEVGQTPINIKVTGKCFKRNEEEVLEIEITDQGIGLSEDWDLNHLNGIGIKNIQDRIWSYCGKKYGVDVFNHLRGGVVAKIILPVIRNQTELTNWMESQQQWLMFHERT